jgi:hypothetical protein
MKTMKRMTELTWLTLLIGGLLVGCDDAPKRDDVGAKLDELDRRLDVADQALKKHAEETKQAKLLMEMTDILNKNAKLLEMKKQELEDIGKELATLVHGDPQRKVLLERFERIREEVALLKPAHQ